MNKSVLIPLAGRRGESGRVGVIQTTDRRPQYEPAKGVHPVTAGLMDVELDKAGKVALQAARQYPRPRSLGLLLPSHGDLFLESVDDRTFGNIAENSDSAQLGLALALLMAERVSPYTVVAATGALELPPGGSTRDRLVGAVGGLKEKFAGLAAYLRAHKGGEARRKPLYVFTPQKTLTGEPVLEAYAEDLAEVRRAGEEAEIEVRVTPVARLSEAVKALKATGRRKHPREWLARLGLAGGTLLAFGLSALGLWAAQPPEMRFTPITPYGQDLSFPSPVRSQFAGGSNRYILQPSCFGPDGAQHVPIQEGLSLRVEVKADWAPLWAHHFLVIVLGDELIEGHASVKAHGVEALDLSGRPVKTPEGEIVWGLRVNVEPPAEEMKIILLGRRLLPFDIEAVKRGLNEVMTAAPREMRINAAMSRLAKIPAGKLDYSFHAVEKLEDCVLQMGE